MKTFKNAYAVFHFAGIADIGKASLDYITSVKQNILGTTQILEACVKCKVKRFIFGSTIYVYSDLGSFYRTSKQSCELLIENYNKIYDLNFTILRYGALYGRRANDFNFIGNVIKQALLDKKIVREGNGEEIRDYIHVKDVISGLQILAEKGDAGEIYNIATGKSMQFRHMLDLMIEHANCGSYELVDIPDFHKKVGIDDFSCSIDKIKSLGFKPKITLEEGIKNLMLSYKNG